LAEAGLLLVEALSAAGGSTTLLGNALIAGASVREGFVMLGKRLAPPYRPQRLALATNLVALVLAMPLPHGCARFDPHTVPIETCCSALGMRSPSVFCLWLWYAGLPHAETCLAGLANAGMPVAALATSALYLGECLGFARVAGAVLVIFAIVLGALTPTAPCRR
jgi:drug/metabolite transporter (DMT)-like permease